VWSSKQTPTISCLHTGQFSVLASCMLITHPAQNHAADSDVEEEDFDALITETEGTAVDLGTCLVLRKALDALVNNGDDRHVVEGTWPGFFCQIQSAVEDTCTPCTHTPCTHTPCTHCTCVHCTLHTLCTPASENPSVVRKDS